MASNNRSLDRDELDASPYTDQDLTRLLGRQRPQNHSPALSFSELVIVFDGLELWRDSASNNKQKRKIRRNTIKRFINTWKGKVGPDVFPAVRLLMPSLDAERRINITTRSLGKMICEVEYVNSNTSHYKTLQDWKAETSTGGTVSGARDFAQAFNRLWLKRDDRRNARGMSIDEVNQCLDMMSNPYEQQKQAIRNAINDLPLAEFKWFLRILLREMHFNLLEVDFWKSLSPRSEEVYKVTSSLRFVCMAPHDDGSIDEQHLSIGPGKFFRPQLAHDPVKADTVVGFLQKSIDKLDVEGTMEARFPDHKLQNYFFIEEKLDGHRVQVHISRAAGENTKFKWLSRNGTDYTKWLGSHIPDATSAEAATGFTITRYLEHFITRKNPFSLVFDGEVVAWDPEQERVLPLNELMKAVHSQWKHPSEKKPWPKFVAFDVVYFHLPPPGGDENGAGCLQFKSHYIRQDKLLYGVAPIPHRFEPIESVKGHSVDDLLTHFDRVMLDGGEGLIIKDPYSVYQPDKRSSSWVKIKPVRVGELSGTYFKVVIVGGNRGTGKNTGRISSYLCAVAADENREEFLTCIKVPSNSLETQSRLDMATNGKWHNWDKANPPSFLKLGENQHERPDCWIRPSESVLVSVTCSEVALSRLYPTGKAFRFPKLEDIHIDESWESGMTLAEFETAITSGPAHLSRSM